jgi:hypothetical protein
MAATMTKAVQSKRLSVRKLAPFEPSSAVKPPQCTNSKHLGTDEPLEASLHESEAPELRQESRAEAPDAGRGSCHSLTREFSHGRSRS